MKGYIKELVVLGIVIGVLVLLSNLNLTGDVVWEPTSNDNCDRIEIDGIWDSVFKEISFEIDFLTENEIGGDCEKYVVYKNDSAGQLWVIFGENYNSSWDRDFQYFNGKRVLSHFNLSFSYFNATSSFIESFNAICEFDLKKEFLNDVAGENLTNWSIQDAAALNNKFEELYRLGDLLGEDFSNGGDYFDFDELGGNDVNYSSFAVAIYKNESVSYGVHSIIIYDLNFVVSFLEDILDYRFDINSSWNFAFNLSDYFNVSDDVAVEFESTGIGNTNGELINFSINEDNVSFMPARNFNGSFEFKLVAVNPAGDNVSSNLFNITISDPNNKPTLIKGFKNIHLPYGENVSLFLDEYFEDSDGDNLTYSVSKVGGVDFRISNNIVTFWLNDDFNIYAKLKIYASDGKENTVGSWFYLYENISVEVLAEENNSEVDEINGSVDVEDIGDKNDIISKPSMGVNKDWVKWVVWVVIVIIILGIVMFVIWFLVLRKNDKLIGSVNSKAGPTVVLV